MFASFYVCIKMVRIYERHGRLAISCPNYVYEHGESEAL